MEHFSQQRRQQNHILFSHFCSELTLELTLETSKKSSEWLLSKQKIQYENKYNNNMIIITLKVFEVLIDYFSGVLILQ